MQGLRAEYNTSATLFVFLRMHERGMGRTRRSHSGKSKAPRGTAHRRPARTFEHSVEPGLSQDDLTTALEAFCSLDLEGESVNRMMSCDVLRRLSSRLFNFPRNGLFDRTRGEANERTLIAKSSNTVNKKSDASERREAGSRRCFASPSFAACRPSSEPGATYRVVDSGQGHRAENQTMISYDMTMQQVQQAELDRSCPST